MCLKGAQGAPPRRLTDSVRRFLGLPKLTEPRSRIRGLSGSLYAKKPSRRELAPAPKCVGRWQRCLPSPVSRWSRAKKLMPSWW